MECYEHRLLMGLPDGVVHHDNEDHADNDPGNLVVMGHLEHSHHHRPPMDADVLRYMYESGFSIECMADAMGAHPRSVTRSLKRYGCKPPWVWDGRYRHRVT